MEQIKKFELSKEYLERLQSGIAVEDTAYILDSLAGVNVADIAAILDELETFADAINNNTTPIVTLEQGTEALKVAHIIINDF